MVHRVFCIGPATSKKKTVQKINADSLGRAHRTSSSLKFHQFPKRWFLYKRQMCFLLPALMDSERTESPFQHNWCICFESPTADRLFYFSLLPMTSLSPNISGSATIKTGVTYPHTRNAALCRQDKEKILSTGGTQRSSATLSVAKALLKVSLSEQHAEGPTSSVVVKQKHDPPISQTRPYLSYTLPVRQLITRQSSDHINHQ